MAGLGRKVFNAGEVLSAANVQGYLQDQVVQVYSGTAARSSALGTAVSEGMMSYLTDSNELSVYTSNGTAAWSPVNLAQSNNAVINGAFDFWQRGTSFTSSGYTADRWNLSTGNSTSPSVTRQSFTLGSAPVSGYEGTYYADIAGTLANASTGYLNWEQKIEDVRAFAGQTITLSFWTKGSTAGTANTNIIQNFGSGGSSQVFVLNTNFAITTSWTRIVQTIAIPSIAGKTIGTGSYLDINFVKNMGSSYPEYGASNYTGTLSIWGVQVEAGSVATPFRRSSPTLQGELAACQRYAVAFGGESAYQWIGSGSSVNTNSHRPVVPLPVKMRTKPTSITVSSNSHFAVDNGTAFTATITTFAIDTGTNSSTALGLQVDTSSGIGSAGGNVRVLTNNTTSALLVVSAEL